ncbi:MAG: DHH family phosphoesterase [Puniceicoccales bacterium]|jgi:phosphoesterase RecJ-like protein|nr:DHH family phosphoesterase [Puniceicoccales bacterium]
MGDQNLMDLLFRHRSCNIVGHIRPDGDCIGSQLAIFNLLKDRGIACNIVKNDNYGSILSQFFEGYPVLDADSFDPQLPLICVDCSDFKRTGEKIFGRCKSPYLNIDHHISNEKFAQHNVVDASRVSTTELIAHALISSGIDFGKTVADFLYLGIVTDSGRFAYDSTSLMTIKIVETLMEKGVSISEIYSRVYERNSLQRYHLLERFLHNVTVFADGMCCTSFVTDDDFRETQTEPLDSEGFVNYTRQIAGVVAGAFLEFHGSYVKCSLRSKGSIFHMETFAKKFGGGGHPAAAGFTINARENFGEFYGKFQNALAEHVAPHLQKLEE